jgi:hypothetical protein
MPHMHLPLKVRQLDVSTLLVISSKPVARGPNAHLGPEIDRVAKLDLI